MIRPQIRSVSIAHATLLLLILSWTCISPPPAVAQGSAVVTITSPTPGSTVAGTITVRASVSSAGVLVVGVQFKLDGANLSAEDTTAPYSVTWDTLTVGNGPHILTAVARDALGLRYTSDPVPVTVSNGLPIATRFEEMDLSTTYTVGWIHRVTGKPFSGGTAAYSPKTDGRATFTFAGTSVKWIGFRGPQTGIALVFLDGHLQAQVDTYSPTEEVKAVIYSATGLEARSHTLMIEVTGLKNPASADSIVVADAFDVEPSSPPPAIGTPLAVGKRFEETDPSSTYTAGWTPGNTEATWSGGTAAVSATPSAQVNFTFVGTSVNWIGYRGPQAGIARVFVDGAFLADVDTYEPTRLQAVDFTISQLSYGNHTLTVQATGLKNPASTDSLIFVDAFDIRSRFEEAHPSIAYSGTWNDSVSRAWSDRTAMYTWEANARATLTFTGTSVRWIAYRGPIGGIARVYLDGAFVREIDTYAVADEVQAVLFSAAGLALGSHTLTVEVTGWQNPAATNDLIAIDAFDINF